MGSGGKHQQRVERRMSSLAASFALDIGFGLECSVTCCYINLNTVVYESGRSGFSFKSVGGYYETT